MHKVIKDIYPSKAQYIKGENVDIILELDNEGNMESVFRIELRISFLLNEVSRRQEEIILRPKENKTISINLGAYEDDFRGYGVDVFIYRDGSLADTLSTAFDVVDDWRKSARYGFLSEFNASDEDDISDVDSLRRLHLNMVQFYDWMYRHDDLIPKEDIFTDLMGRELSYKVVKEKIGMCQRLGIRTMAYGAVYAASRDFFKQHMDWALYGSSGNPLSLGETFFIMNISTDSPWHNHIIKEYEKAISEAGFDGIHMDTYGFPKTAVSRLNGLKRIERLQEHFPQLIDNTKIALSTIEPDNCLIFNNVGNWPVTPIIDFVDAIYIEVWKPYERYHHIQQLIRDVRASGTHKPIVLAAYLKPFETKDKVGVRAAEGAMRIITAAIVSNGAYHLLLGENKGILTHAYYALYSKLDDEFFDIVRDYYDFIVRYSNVFYDSELVDVSMTHICGDNEEYVIEADDFSTYGEPDKVWVTIKEKPSLKYISFVNLKGNAEDYWNKGKVEPSIRKDLRLIIEIQKEVKAVYAASPDSGTGRPQLLQYDIIDGVRSKKLSVVMPDIHYWSILVVEFNEMQEEIEI